MMDKISTSLEQVMYVDAYRYAQVLATHHEYQQPTWQELEGEIYQCWQKDYQDKCAWDNFRDAVRHAWLSLS